MNVTGIIPARGGSKGIPSKSIAMCAGRPLLAYTVEAALASRCLKRTILSTDDPDIADVGRRYGVAAPFLRPAEIARDDTPMIEVIRHAVQELTESGELVSAIALLQPTSPLRTARHIDEAFALFQETDADSVVSVVRVPHQFAPSSLLKLTGNGRIEPWLPNEPLITLRQAKSPLYARNGPALLFLRPEMVKHGTMYSRNTFGYLMDAASSVDVDEMDSLRLAEFLILDRQTSAR